jgi:hypothetical protein
MTTDEQSRRVIVTRLTEVPRSELDLKALGGRMIEHVASPNGDYYTAFGGDPGLIGNDVVAYYVREDGTPIMLQRCHRPSSRAELEQLRATREEWKAAREAAAKQRRERLSSAAK